MSKADGEEEEEEQQQQHEAEDHAESHGGNLEVLRLPLQGDELLVPGRNLSCVLPLKQSSLLRGKRAAARSAFKRHKTGFHCGGRETLISL